MRLTKRCLLFLGVFLTLLIFLPSATSQGKTDNSPDWFYPSWAAEAKNNKPIVVRDTDSALGRYSVLTKEIGLKDLARIHGHLCDGLVIAFLEIKAVLDKLFPEQAALENEIRKLRAEGKLLDAKDIDTVEMMADRLSQKLLNSQSEEILDIKPLPQYQFRANDLFSERGDILNKAMPRRKP